MGEGEIRHLGESPKQCRIKTTCPGEPEQLGVSVLFETLALYSYMTFENTKVAKIGKGVFFKLN